MDALPITAAPLIQHVGGARSHLGLPSVEAGDAESWQNWNVVIKNQNKYSRNVIFQQELFG